MHPGVEDELIDVLVRKLDTAVTAAAIVEWATNALVAGEDTPSLIILAGLDRNSSLFEATPWLEKTLAELHVTPLSPDDLRRAYVGAVSRAMLSRRVGTKEALDLIHKHAVTPLAHPPDLSSWCYVWEGLDPGNFRNLTRIDIDSEARKLAEHWGRRAGLSISLQSSDRGGA